MGKYKTFGSLFNRIYRNDLNQNFVDIEADIQAQKTRVDNLITGTPQPSEVVDARGGSPVLKDRLDGFTTSLAEKAKKTDVDTQIAAVASGSPKGVYTTLTALQTAYPTGNTNAYLVTGNVNEVDTLNVTSVPTASGNVTVTLNGVATNIAVTSGVKEVASLTVSAVPTVAGNVTVTLNGVATTIALDPATDTTTDLVATKIRNTTFPTSAVTGGTASTVTFTAAAVGVKTDATYSAGATGSTGTMSTTTQGVDADATTTIATKIRGTSFSGWTTGGTGTSVTFTATVAGVKTAPSYSAGSTGTTGTMSITTAGTNVDGNWYYWNGTLWTAGGVYQSTGIADGTVTGSKLDSSVLTSLRGKTSSALFAKIFQTGKNLLNKNDLYSNGGKYFVNAANGQITSTSFSLAATNPILLDTTNTQLTISASQNLNTSQGYRFIDANSNVISYGAYSGTTSMTLTIPFNAMAIQLTIDSSNTNYQAEYGATATSYVDYSGYIGDLKAAISELIIALPVSKNLFDKSNLYSNGSAYYINVSTGIITSTTYSIVVSNPILIDSSQGNLTISVNNQMSSSQGYRFLDFKGNVISYGALSNTTSLIVAIPSNASYFQTSLYQSNLNSLQVEYGATATSYAEHNQNITNLRSFATNLSNLLNTGKNLFNKNILYSSGAKYYVNAANGQITSTSFSLAVSNPILIDVSKSSLTISAIGNLSSSLGYRFLDYNGNVISYGGYTNTLLLTISIPSNAVYFQTSLDQSNLSTLQIEYGSVATSYDSFLNPYSSQVNIILPSLIKLNKGKNINLYYDNFMFKDYKVNMNARIDTIAGMTNYSRQFAGSPTENDKTTSSASITYLSTLKQKNSIPISYKIVDATTRTNKTLNMMCCGDSFTEIGWWVDGLIEKANSEGVTLNTIGLMDTIGKLGFTENQTGGTLSGTFLTSRATQSSTYKISVSGLTIKDFNIHFNSYAQYSSNGKTWTVTGYKVDSNGNGYMRISCSDTTATLPASGILTKTTGTGDSSINYTGAEVVDRNPFWNPTSNQLDFSYYINKWGFNNPDVMVFMFGWNDYHAWDDPSSFISNCVTFITAFHAQYPNAHVIFSVPPFGYTAQPTYDVNGTKYSRLTCANNMFSTFSSYGYVDIVPSYAFVDTINGFETFTIQPSNRYSETVTLSKGWSPSNTAIDETHNNQSGMKQISDAVYPYVVDLLV